MPEAAEVAVAARQLADVAVGHRLERLPITHPRTTRAQPVEALGSFVERRVQGARRHGKWIVVTFDGVDVELGVHLRMSGQLLVRSPADVPPDRHVHAVLDLGDRVVWFRDPRTFGELRVLPDGAPVAPDLHDDRVDAAALWHHARRRNVGVKAVLLDQLGAVSGIGSYLADEALHRAGIAPTKGSSILEVSAWERILRSARAIAEESASLGGVTLADEGWVDLYGAPGSYGPALKVHARATCATCGESTRRAVVGGRSARWCPRCQHANRRR